MNDITACSGKDCPLAKTCYRYTCKKDRYQSYFVDVPCVIDDNHVTCDHYWQDNLTNEECLKLEKECRKNKISKLGNKK